MHFFGLRLNLYIAVGARVVGAVWFYLGQRRPEPPEAKATTASRPAPAHGTPDAPPSPESSPASHSQSAKAESHNSEPTTP